MHSGPQPACQGRDPTPRPGPETQSVHPPAVHSRRRRLPPRSARNGGLQFFADVQVGRRRQILLLRSRGDVLCELNEPGATASRPARAPGGRRFRGGDRWRPVPIKTPESSRAQRRPAGLQPQDVWSETRTGLGVEAASVRQSRLTVARVQVSCGSGPPPAGRGRRRFCS